MLSVSVGFSCFSLLSVFFLITMHFKVKQHFLKSIPDELLKFFSSAAAFYCTDCCSCCISDVETMGIHIRFFVPVLCAHFRH